MIEYLKDEIVLVMFFDGVVSYYIEVLEVSLYWIFSDILKNELLKKWIEKLMECGGSIEQFFDKWQNIDVIWKDIEEYFELRGQEEVEWMFEFGVVIKKENGCYDLVGIGKDVVVVYIIFGSYKDFSK